MIKIEEKDIWIFPSERRLSITYYGKSITHPAKMSLHLCREIIKRYSEKGDLILDCMAGIGSTLIEGMILGRRCLGIEYEQKFVDLAQKNIDLTVRKMGFMKDFGSSVILKGDSRELSKVLANGGEKIIESGISAFANSTMEKPPSDKWNGPDFSGQKYSDDKSDKNQIGNLDYKPIGERRTKNNAINNTTFSNRFIIKITNLILI